MDNPHDKLFKATFGQLDNARDHFKRFLSVGLRTMLDLATLESVPGSFVDEAFRDRHADLLFRALGRREDAPVAYVYLLFEHQSSVDRFMAFRMYRYMGNIWQRHRDEEPDARTLPPIVALVLYNGERRWDAPVSLHGLVRPLGMAARRVPEFEMLLTDLGAETDERLRSNSLAGLVRLVMKVAPRARDVADLERLGPAIDRARRTTAGLRGLALIAEYLMQVVPSVEPREVIKLIADHAGKEGEEMAMSAYQVALERSRLEGLEQGRVVGLLRQLEFRFGKLDEATTARVRRPTSDDLDRWEERILTGTSLEDVLDG